jgi:hypothetical protein
VELDPIQKITKDLKIAAKTLSKLEARYLVDTYYQMQENRIRADGQVRSLEKADSPEPHDTLSWLATNAEILENNVKSALDHYGNAHLVGRWSKSIVGIGPVISAGLIANIDMEPWRCVIAYADKKKKACTAREPHGPACHRIQLVTAGHIWRFAGLDPTVTWGKGEKRPWNAAMKTLCWKLGESFVKQSSHKDDVFGKLYVTRKIKETAKNLAGDFSVQALEKLEKFKIDKGTDTYAWYAGHLTVEKAQQILDAPQEKRQGLAIKLASKGREADGQPMLPPGHIHARAKRWAVKLFLSCWHEGAYFAYFDQLPPKPYVLTLEGHAHEFIVPNMEEIPGWKEARMAAGRPV